MSVHCPMRQGCRATSGASAGSESHHQRAVDKKNNLDAFRAICGAVDSTATSLA